MPLDTSSFQGMGSKVLEKLMTGGIVVLGAILLCGIIVSIALYIRYLRQFNIKVEILSLRGRSSKGEPIFKLIYDIGGIIANKKTKARWFRLRNHKLDLPTPPYEAIQLDAKGVNHIKILQKSDTEFYYLLPDKIDMTVVVRDGKEIPVSQLNIKIAEGDVTYWGQIRKRSDDKMFDAESLALKLIPYIGLILLFMGIIFLSYFITSHWGEFASAAQALKEAAQALKGSTGSVVTTTPSSIITETVPGV